MSKGKVIVVTIVVALVVWHFGPAIEHWAKEYFYPTFANTKTRMAKRFVADVSDDVERSVEYDKNGREIVYKSDKERLQAYQKGFERIDNNSNFLNSRQGDGTQNNQSAQTVAARTREVTNVMESAVIEGGAGKSAYKYQLDARQVWPTLPESQGGPALMVSGGDQITFNAGGTVCALGAPCAGPNGQDGLSRFSKASPLDFPIGNKDANFQALICNIGSDTFQIGDHKTYTVPAGVERETISVMNNIRLQEISQANGGQVLTITITRRN